MKYKIKVGKKANIEVQVDSLAMQLERLTMHSVVDHRLYYEYLTGKKKVKSGVDPKKFLWYMKKRISDQPSRRRNLLLELKEAIEKELNNGTE